MESVGINGIKMIPGTGEEYYYKIDNLLLRSCQQIRNLVRKRWKKETGKKWVDGEDQGTEFISKCPHIFQQSQKIQKVIIAKGCLEEWDLSLLSNVLLQQFGGTNLTKSETKAVRDLTRVRNDLAHHPSKKLCLEEYTTKLSILKISLLTLGLSESDIEDAIRKAGVTSPIQEQLESVIELFAKATMHEKDGDFEAAVEIYTKVVSMPSLRPVHRGIAYEKRTSCYLTMMKEQRGGNASDEEHRKRFSQQANLDANQALKLNENSWNAHCLLAQCHKLSNNVAVAIHFFQKALAISPGQSEIKRELDDCKLLLTLHKEHDEPKPNEIPTNHTERIAYLEKIKGVLTEQQFLAMLNSCTDLAEFEKEHHLDTNKRLTYFDRLQRKLSLESVMDKEFLQIMESMKSARCVVGMHLVEAEKLTDPEIIKSIAVKAAQGSITATNLLETLRCTFEIVKLLVSTEDHLSEENEQKLVELLYTCATIQKILIPLEYAYKMKKIIEKLFDNKSEEKGDSDMKIRYCFVFFNLAGLVNSQDTLSLELLKEGILLYPHNPFYYELLAGLLASRQYFRSALQHVKQGLKLFPKNTSLLYAKLICLISTSDPFPEASEEITSACEDFLKEAPLDDVKVPETYYILAFQHIPKVPSEATFVDDFKTLKQLEHYYNQGLNAEKNQLPCYIPCRISERKNVLKSILVENKNLLETKPNDQNLSTILDRKPYLNDPMRKVLLVQHRQKIAMTFKKRIYFGHHIGPPKTQMCPKKLSNLKPITLKDMNPSLDFIYQDCAIYLTIIDDAGLGFVSIYLLAEDENGSVTSVYLSNLEQHNNIQENIQEKFGFGNRIAIKNPCYTRIGSSQVSNGIRNIRIDEPKNIVQLKNEKTRNMCRFCGEEEAPQKCSNCRRSYCSKECQLLDWKMFKHKLICSITVESLND